jgi:hypothetical protein
LPKGGKALVDELSVLYHLPPPQLTSFAFTVGRSPSPAVFFWAPVRPSDQQQGRTVDLAISGIPDGEYVLLDTLTGECRRLPRPQRRQAEALFAGMPLCDYPMAIAPQDAFLLSHVPTWVGLFADPAQIVDRSFTDRTDDFYLRGAWSVLFDLAERLDSSPASLEFRDKLEAIKRVRLFWRAFSVVPNQIAIAASAPVSMTLRPAPGTWRESVANPGSRNVNRYFYELDDADAEATVHGVTMKDRVLPQRPWADSPNNAFTWFTLRRPGEPTEVFVVVPEEHLFDGRDCRIDLSLRPRATALLLSSRGGEGQCLAYWSKAVATRNETSYTLELEDHFSPYRWADGAVVIDPRKGGICGEASVGKPAEGGRIRITAPSAPQPLLLVPRRFARQVESLLLGSDPSPKAPFIDEKQRKVPGTLSMAFGERPS